ncbi:MAG TPA: N-formylglutamate amidohydrolase [Candidatus Polarisedimenticolia bacterium]|nr:N-formylglutamate amidohydrolase [Candidatus Polarisedimenticolia bacterium]
MTAQSALLAPGDPPAFELCNAQARVRGLLICDHASAAIPAALGTLGLDEGQRRLHIAWDIGAADVTRRLAKLLGVAAILSGYSRLVIDCNRQLDDPTSIPQESDGVAVPGNRGLSEVDRKQRAQACFWPYQQAIEGWIAARRTAGEQPVIVSLHSFTPVMDGFERPWHIGILANRDRRVAHRLIAALRCDPTLSVGDNEPYDGRHGRGYGMMVHGEEMGLPFALIEMRQDLIDTHHGAEAWAQRLAPILARIFAEGVSEGIEP